MSFRGKYNLGNTLMEGAIQLHNSYPILPFNHPHLPSNYKPNDTFNGNIQLCKFQKIFDARPDLYTWASHSLIDFSENPAIYRGNSKYSNGYSKLDLLTFKNRLTNITNNILDYTPSNSISINNNQDHYIYYEDSYKITDHSLYL